MKIQSSLQQSILIGSLLVGPIGSIIGGLYLTAWGIGSFENKLASLHTTGAIGGSIGLFLGILCYKARFLPLRSAMYCFLFAGFIKILPMLVIPEPFSVVRYATNAAIVCTFAALGAIQGYVISLLVQQIWKRQWQLESTTE
jgi:uncharacterized membrane protein YeaQ/YmgE (transglycosylase-associated protein family)